MKYSKFKLTTFIAMLIIFIPVSLFASHSSSKKSVEGYIFYYNDESNINNFASVKAMFDKFLSSYGNFKFQPFDQKSIFEKTILNINTPTVLITSSWEFRSLNKKLHLIPYFIAIKNGKYTYKKVLSTERHISGVEGLSGKTLASSGSLDFTNKLLIDMLGADNQDIISSIRILSVPKDIDGLLAISYGIADAAITMESSLKQIKEINPKLRERLKILLTSNEILMPIVALGRTNMGCHPEKLIQVIRKLNSTETGRKMLSSLSFDGWIDISDEIKEKLIK